MSSPRVYILGLKERGYDQYGLTTWLGDSPMFRAVYDENPGYWEDSVKFTPSQIIPDKPGYKIDESKPYRYDGFGWLAHEDSRLYTDFEITEFIKSLEEV